MIGEKFPETISSPVLNSKKSNLHNFFADLITNSSDMPLIISKIKSAIRSHYRLLHSQFYIISPHVTSSSSTTAKNWHFPFILFIYLITLLYGTFYMPYETTGQIQWDNLLNNEHIFTYQMLPPLIATQFAAANNLSIVVSFFLIIALWKAPKIASEFQLTFQADAELFSIGQKLRLDQEQSVKIQKCFEFAELAYYNIFFPTYVNLQAFYFVGLWVNNSYTVSAGSAVFWLFLNPLMTFYLIYGNKTIF